jgi:ankyrin repeat protein
VLPEAGSCAVGPAMSGADTAPNTALYFAAHAGEDEKLSEMLSSGVSPDDGNAGYPAVYAAAEQNRLGAMRLLLAAGAQVDKSAPGGETALYMAVWQGHCEMTALLLSFRAAVAGGPGPSTALTAAKQRDNADILRLVTAASEAQATTEACPSPEPEAEERPELVECGE